MKNEIDVQNRQLAVTAQIAPVQGLGALVAIDDCLEVPDKAVMLLLRLFPIRRSKRPPRHNLGVLIKNQIPNCLNIPIRYICPFSYSLHLSYDRIAELRSLVSPLVKLNLSAWGYC